MKIKCSKNSSMNNWPRGTFIHQNPNTHLPFSLSKRKTENYDPYKTTDESMDIQSAINTHYPSFLTSLQTLEGPQYSPNSMCGGDITMCASNRETNTKQPLKQDMDSLSPRSCSLAFVIPQQPSKP